jgi:hypothetical protein
MTWDVVTELVSSLVWPVTVFLLAILLRKQLTAALTRLSAAEVAGAKFRFGKAAADFPRGKDASSSVSQAGLLVSKTGSIYWLGHDIMWVVDALLRGAPVDYVRHGLVQVTHHVKEIGLANTRYAEVARALLEATSLGASVELTVEVRNAYALQLSRLVDQIGAVVESAQADFQAGPEGDKVHPET